MSGVPMYRCGRCQRVHFPRRPVCPSCHATEFSEVVAHSGVVEELTTTAEATIASVRTHLGPIVIAALRIPDGRPGIEVSLATEPGAAAGYVPTPERKEAR